LVAYLRVGMARVKWLGLDPAGQSCQGTSPDRNCILPMSEAANQLAPSLHFERHDAVGVLRLCRPHKRNALDEATTRGIEDFFSTVPDHIKAVIIHGEGEHFCAGLDLSDLAERDIAAGITHSRAWHRAFERLEFGRAPVVAVLHGAVVGGGLELAAACHIRVAEHSAYYALPEGGRGIFLGGGGSVRLPRLIGAARVVDMMLTGRTYGADEGGQLGFSQYVFEAGAGLAKAIALAERIVGNAPMSNFAAMHVLPHNAEQDRASGFVMEALMAAIAQGDPEAKRRLRDFLAKRAPKTVHR
jgi:enoyl-CoA hydratase/carnithine racemase